jgi:hypothetical protein
MFVPGTTTPARSGCEASTPVSRTATVALPEGVTEPYAVSQPIRGSCHWSAYRGSFGIVAVSRLWSRSTRTTSASAWSDATVACSSACDTLAECMKSGAIAPVSTAPAAVISASCCVCDVPLANVTMYGTNGPEGGALVVVGGAVVVVSLVVVFPLEDVDGTVVVAPEDVVLVVAVVVAPEDVDGAVVVAAVVVVGAVLVVVAPEVAPVDVDELVVAAAVDVVSLDVELEKVLPTVIGETSPSAPETSRPRPNTAATATMIRIWRRRGPRSFTQ